MLAYATTLFVYQTQKMAFSVTIAVIIVVCGKSSAVLLSCTYNEQKYMHKISCSLLVSWKATGNHSGKYVRLWVHICTILWCRHATKALHLSITPRHDMLKCHKPAGNSRRLERVLTTREVRNPRKFGFAKFVSEFNAYDRYALSSAIHSLREMWITNASFNNFATSTKISSLTSGWHANFVALLQSTRLATLATQFVNSAIVGCWTDKVTRTWVQFKHKLHHKAKKNKWSK